jgi:hypothetical protein
MRFRLKSVAAVLLSGIALGAVAADQTFTAQGQFEAAAGPLALESFESLAASTRSINTVVAPLFTVTPTDTLISVQSSATTPEDGFGSYPVLGSQYLFNYNPNQPSGTLKFTFSAPTTAFGFVMTDVGEATGIVSLRTNAGAFTTDQVLATYPPLQGNGASFFFGLTQNTAFTEAYVTVTGVDEAYGIDAVRVTAVPEPVQAALLLAGLGLVGAIARRRTTA